ncbi:MAG: hypothetical protein ACI9GM_000470 [Salibacteraceae bacterium]|jgi:hypothetical protein
MTSNKLISRLVLAAFLLINQFTYGQCSMCRAVVETDISGKGSGINNGIVYLMAFPYLLVALIAFGLVYKMRKDAA